MFYYWTTLPAPLILIMLRGGTQVLHKLFKYSTPSHTFSSPVLSFISIQDLVSLLCPITKGVPDSQPHHSGDQASNTRIPCGTYSSGIQTLTVGGCGSLLISQNISSCVLTWRYLTLQLSSRLCQVWQGERHMSHSHESLINLSGPFLSLDFRELYWKYRQQPPQCCPCMCRDTSIDELRRDKRPPTDCRHWNALNTTGGCMESD